MKRQDDRVRLNKLLSRNNSQITLQIAGFHNQMLELQEKWHDRKAGFLIHSLFVANILLAVIILESLVRLLASVTIAISNSNILENHVHLSEVELEFLAEERIALDTRPGEPSRKHRRAKTEERMARVPVLFFKTLGVEFRIDKGSRQWQDLKKLIELRNNLTHPKTELQLRSGPSEKFRAVVSINDVLLAAEVLVWYFNIVTKELNSIAGGTSFTWDKVHRLYIWLSAHAAAELAGKPRAYLQKKYGLPAGIDIVEDT